MLHPRHGIPLFIFTAFLLTGCHSTTAPEWMTNPKIRYPETSHLVALGEGDTRQAAENSAAANLARIFKARIESEEHLLDFSREGTTGLTRTTDYTADINIRAAETLLNIQHAESWQAPNGRVHAIAYLDRTETAAIYRDQCSQLTQRIDFLIAQARPPAPPLKRYATLRAATHYAAENERLLRQLAVIHPPSRRLATPTYSADALRRDLTEAAQAIRVRIAMENDPNGRLTATLEKLFTRYGFVVAEPANLIATGRVEITDTEQRVGNLVFVRYRAIVQINHPDDGTLTTLDEHGREGHISLEEARNRALRTLENAVIKHVSPRIDALLAALADPPSNPAN